jgi:hypothetical protein
MCDFLYPWISTIAVQLVGKVIKEQTNFGNNIQLEKTNCNNYLFGFRIPEDCTLVLWEVFSYSLKLFEPHIPRVANEAFTH